MSLTATMNIFHQPLSTTLELQAPATNANNKGDRADRRKGPYKLKRFESKQMVAMNALAHIVGAMSAHKQVIIVSDTYCIATLLSRHVVIDIVIHLKKTITTCIRKLQLRVR